MKKKMYNEDGWKKNCPGPAVYKLLYYYIIIKLLHYRILKVRKLKLKKFKSWKLI